MPAKLARLFGYPVFPGQPPEGGAVTITAELIQALSDAYARAALQEGLAIALIIDTARRSNDVRDAIMKTAFGADRASQTAADTLAARLSSSMDLRSKPCLLIISVHGQGPRREVVIWTFPKDEAFRFRTGRRRERIEVVEDIFSRSSYLRKAAAFAGRNVRTGFLSGRVVDFQANVADRYVADFWVERFLDARLEMGGEEGTMLFAKTVKQAFDALAGNLNAQEQLASAVSLIRRTSQRLSVRSFADQYLDGDAAAAIIERAPNARAVDALFDFDPQRFDELIRFRVFHLEHGVMVTAPFGEIGESVIVEEEGATRMLRAEGFIQDESVRSRRG